MRTVGTKFHERSIAAANAEAAQLRDKVNRYEAAQPTSPKRSFIPAFVRDARIDANSWSRWEMTRKIRYFERNSWLVQTLRNEHVKWTVGPNGLQLRSASKDEEWAKRINESYERWCEAPCLDSTIAMPQVHKQIAGSHFLENDLFILNTGKKIGGQKTQPAIQLVESHRCTAPGTTYTAQQAEDMVDGVQLGKDANGRLIGPTGYWILDNILGDQWAFRAVQDMHHVFDPERIGMFRGITRFHGVMNTLHDLDDLEQMEMERAKENATVSNVITSASGELNMDSLRQARYGNSAVTVNSDTKDEDVNRRVMMYRKIIGSRTIALAQDEKIEQFGNDIPSAAQQWYWRYKIGQVCSTAGVHLILVFPELIESIQGTVVRGIYDNADETFKGQFFLYARAAIKMWRFFVNWARYNDPSVVDAPADWDKVHVIPPRAVNVDIGYTAAATVANLAVGITNWDDIAGRMGTTAEVLITKKAKNVAMIQKIALEMGVDPSQVSEPMAGVILQLAQADQAEALAASAGDEPKTGDEPAPKKKPAKASK